MFRVLISYFAIYYIIFVILFFKKKFPEGAFLKMYVKPKRLFWKKKYPGKGILKIMWPFFQALEVFSKKYWGGKGILKMPATKNEIF